MNCVICKPDGTIRRVVTNAVRKQKRIEGENGSITGKWHLFDLIWTSQAPTPIYDDDGHLTGYQETASDLTPETPESFRDKPDGLTLGQKNSMLGHLEDLATFSFSDIDDFVNNISNLAEAKQFMKRLAKVQLAMIKLIESRF